MSGLHLEVVTPDKQLLSEDVDYVSAPGHEGEFGVLPGHIPYISALKCGILTYVVGSIRKRVFVSAGFAEVQDNVVTVLAESAEREEDINLERAESACQRAKERIAQAVGNANIDDVRAKAALQRALVRISMRR